MLHHWHNADVRDMECRQTRDGHTYSIHCHRSPVTGPPCHAAVIIDAQAMYHSLTYTWCTGIAYTQYIYIYRAPTAAVDAFTDAIVDDDRVKTTSWKRDAHTSFICKCGFVRRENKSGAN